MWTIHRRFQAGNVYLDCLKGRTETQLITLLTKASEEGISGKATSTESRPLRPFVLKQKIPHEEDFLLRSDRNAPVVQRIEPLPCKTAIPVRVWTGAPVTSFRVPPTSGRFQTPVDKSKADFIAPSSFLKLYLTSTY